MYVAKIPIKAAVADRKKVVKAGALMGWAGAMEGWAGALMGRAGAMRG